MAEETRSVYELLAIDKTKEAFASVSENLKASKESFFSWKEAILAAIGVGGLAELVKNSMETGEKMGLLSDQLRINTQDLYALSHAAELNGVSQDAMTQALQKMQMSIGQTIQGTGLAKQYFEEWGVSMDQFAKLGAAEQFQLIGDKIRGLGNASEQAAATQAIFGRGGMEIQAMFNQQGESIDETKRRMVALGAAMDRFDTAKIQKANESLKDLKDVATGVGNTIAVAVSPYIQGLATYLTDAAVKSNGFKDEIGEAVKWVADKMAFLADVIHGLSVVWSGLEVIAYSFAAAVVTVGDLLFQALGTPILKVEEMINSLIEKMNSLLHTHIDKIDTSGIDTALKTSAGFADDMRNKVIDAQSALQAKLNEPMPSEGIKKAFGDWVAASNNAATQVVANHDRLMKQVVDAPGLDDIAIKKLQAQFDKIDKVSETAIQKENADFLAQKKFLMDNEAALDKAKISTKQQTEAIIENLEKTHQDRISKLAQQGALTREKFDAMAWQQQVKTTIGALEQMTAGVATHSKAMFEVNKAAGIANAIVSTAEGVAKALGAYPPPISFIMAAAQLVAGLAQVEAIRNASFGGGTTPSVAGSTPTYNGQPVYMQQTVTPGSQTTQTGSGAQGQQVINLHYNPQIDARGADPASASNVNAAIAKNNGALISYMNERLARGATPG